MKSVTILQGLHEETAKIVSDALRKQYSGEVVSINLIKESDGLKIPLFLYTNVTENTQCVIINGVSEFQFKRILRDFSEEKFSVNPKGRRDFEMDTPSLVLNLLKDADITELAKLHPEFNAI